MLDDLPINPPVPSWNDLFLRFTDADAAAAALLAAGLLTETQALLDQDGNILQPAGYAPASHATIDTVGIITRTSYPDFVPAVTAEREVESMDGQMVTITEVVTPAEYGEPVFTNLDGWHVNVRLPADYPTPESLVDYQVTPANPVRIWA